MKFFGKCPKWDKEQVVRFGSDLDYCLDHLDPGCQIFLGWILIFLRYVRNGKRKKW